MARRRIPATVIAIDLGGTNIPAALVDARGTILARAHRRTPRGGGAIADALIDLCRELTAAAPRPVAAVGLGTPGLLTADGHIGGGCFNLPGWNGYPVRAAIRRATGLPLFGDNDVNAAILGEWRFGGGRGLHDLVLLTFGTGVGGGVIVNDTLLRGVSGCAAELGHIVIVPGGRRCSCGIRGCGEAYLSAAGIVRTWRECGGRGRAGVKEIFAAARRGDRAARQTVARSAQLLGRQLAVLATVFNPAAIFIGGGIARDAKQFLPPARRAAAATAWRPSWRALRVRPAHPEAGILGAAATALQGLERR